MNSEKLDTIFSFKLSLLFDKFPLFLFTQHTTVLFQQITVFLDSLWWKTFIN